MRRVAFRLLLSAVMLALCGCAADRASWALAHAAISPRARQLPRSELEQIVSLVTHATTEAPVSVGQSYSERGSNIMHVVTGFTNDRVTIFDLRRINGKWTIYDHGDGSPTLSTVFTDD